MHFSLPSTADLNLVLANFSMDNDTYCVLVLYCKIYLLLFSAHKSLETKHVIMTKISLRESFYNSIRVISRPDSCQLTWP